MKKIILFMSILIVLLLLLIVSIPASAPVEAPLKPRIEAYQIYNRIWKINVYATNSFDETVEAVWSHKRPCSLAVQYIVPNEDLKLLTNHFHRHRVLYPDFKITFEPGEEKVLDSVYFIGISNWILPGFADGYIPQYIEGFPILPEGDYEISAHMHNYDDVHDGVVEQYPSGEVAYLTIHYPN